MGSQAVRITISPGRAQDWIVSVLNPVIGGIRRELRLNPDGPWYWEPRRKRFEYFFKVHEFVREEFLDNLEDFKETHPEEAGLMDGYDLTLDALASTIATTVDFLAEQKDEDWEAALQSLPADHPPADHDYFFGHIASHFTELPSDYSMRQWFAKKLPLRVLAESRAKVNLEASRKAALAFFESAGRLQTRLKKVRTAIADKYGVRIVPVD